MSATVTKNTAGNDLHFINSSGPKLQNDLSVRTLIRKQAMKNVALTRKKRGNYNRVNAGQLPTPDAPAEDVLGLLVYPVRSVDRRSTASSDLNTSESSTDDDSVDSLIEDTLRTSQRDLWKDIASNADSDSATVGNQLACLSRSLSTEYEASCSRFQVSVTDLSMLTNFNVNSATASMLYADPDRFMTLLGHSQWSYLQFVPGLYGVSDCLTTATDCLLARVRNILIPSKCNKRVELRLYTRALKALQDALQSPKTFMQPDVLCATQLLGLHELLNDTNEAAYNHHIQGSVQLVQHRTPARFESEFEKALFAAHIGPIAYETLLGNKHCYLADPQWLKLYRSLGRYTDSLEDRSFLTVDIRSQMLIIPGIWHDVHKATTGPELFDNDALAELESRCRWTHGDLLDWIDAYRAYCKRHSAPKLTVREIAMRRELYGTALECLVVMKRLLATVCIEEQDVWEAEAQEIAKEILELQETPSPLHSWLFSRHEAGVAYSIISTKEEWSESMGNRSEYERKLMVRSRYVQWSDMLRNPH